MPPVDAPRGRESLDDEDGCGDYDEDPVPREEVEDAPPVENDQQLRADDRSKNRGEPVDERF